MRRNPADAAPKQAAEIRKRELSDLAWVLSDARGRRFIWRLFGLTGIFRNSFTGNSETFFKEGMRLIGTTLWADAHESTHESVLRMQQEAVTQAENDALAEQIERENPDG